MSPILIVSFHRSGSSLVAHTLHAAGLHLGDRLLGAKPSNPYGHYEDTEVIHFHDRLLGEDDHAWYSAGGPVAAFHASSQDWVTTYVARKRARHAVFGVKDPRLCLTIRHWQAALGRIKVVFVHRGAWRSCASLWARAVEDYKAGRTIPLNRRLIAAPDYVARIYLHNVASFLSWRAAYRFAGEDTLVVSHDDIVSGRRSVTSEIRERWGYPLRPINIEDYYDRSAVTVDPDRRIRIGETALADSLDDMDEQFERLCAP